MQTLFQDITKRKLNEVERESLIADLEAKNAELERFTYTVSHDLKSPLVTIKGFLGYIERDVATGNEERLKGDIRRISDAVERMRQLLNELLDFSRIGHIINPSETVSFADLAREAVALVQGRIMERGIEIRIDPSMPDVFGDKKRLLEVLQNLVDNAAKFVGDEHKPKIEIGWLGEDSELGKPVFFVRDNGIGISPKYHEQVFGLFNKLHPDIEGTGIGLALVKRIVEFHGGRIWVESEAGKGSTFFFTLSTTKTSEAEK
jgi:signal transduction histidine kinase